MLGSGTSANDGKLRSASNCRLTSQVYGLGTAAWEYLDNGLLSKQTLPNGAYSQYSYNVANQLTGLANKAPDDSEISTYGTMSYLGTGDLATVTSTIPGASTLAGLVNYAYDAKRELTGEDSTRNGGYDYANVFDGAGNPTTFRDGTGRTYNADNQLTGPESYVYDSNGNPTTWQGTALSWDPENRMLAYGNVLTAGYRGDGLRAWKQTSGGRTYFLYDGINIVCELDSDGDLVAESVFGRRGLLTRDEVQYQFDPLGDAVHQLDGDGAVTANRLFDAWGNELTNGTGPHGYRAQVGYYADAETGLVALAHRYYTPAAGRFLNRDRLRARGGVNLQAYVQGRPLTSRDPSGLVVGEGAIAGAILVGLYAFADNACAQLSAKGEVNWAIAASVGVLGLIFGGVAGEAAADTAAGGAAVAFAVGVLWALIEAVINQFTSQPEEVTTGSILGDAAIDVGFDFVNEHIAEEVSSLFSKALAVGKALKDCLRRSCSRYHSSAPFTPPGGYHGSLPPAWGAAPPPWAIQ